MRVISKYLAITATLLGTTAAYGQSLTKEVVIDRQIEPTVRPSTRPSTLSPDVLNLPVSIKKLQMWEYGKTGTVDRLATRLEPAAYADTFALSPYRGYAAIGYLPTFNLGASAGYRFVDTRTTTAGAWLQYNGQSYKMDGDHLLIPREGKVTLSHHVFSLGADVAQRFRPGTLTAQASFTYGSTGQPKYTDDFTRHATGFDISAGFAGNSTKVPAWVKLAFSHFGYSSLTDSAMERRLFNRIDPIPLKPLRQSIYGLDGSFSVKIDNKSDFGVDLDANFQHLSNLYTLQPTDVGSHDGSPLAATITKYGTSATNFLGTLTPRYRLSTPKVNLRLGFNLQYSRSPKSKKVHISPSVKIAVTPVQQVSVWLEATGGQRFNDIRELYDYCPYQNSAFSGELSTVKYDISLGANFGPAKGFTGRLWGGYSNAQDWLVTSQVNDRAMLMAPIKSLKALRAGLALAYQWRDIVRVDASAEVAQNTDGKQYWAWRDAAKFNINASLTVTPIRPLDITVGWNLRTDRHAYNLVPQLLTTKTSTVIYTEPFWDYTTVGLGQINNLTAAVTYRITPVWTASVHLDNLLGRRWQTIPGIDNPGLTGLIGVAYKF